MASFEPYYRAIFDTLGYPLSEQTATPRAELDEAAARLGVPIPTALRDYYAVAGRERRFNHCLNRFLPPSKWSTDRSRLVFLEENQKVCWWGVSVEDSRVDDPPVAQRLNRQPSTWEEPDHSQCSVFLACMLHYHAASGGLDFSGWADRPIRQGYEFEDHGWQYYGTVRQMRTYSRPQQVMCLFPPSHLLPAWLGNRTVLVAGSPDEDRQRLADELGVVIQ